MGAKQTKIVVTREQLLYVQNLAALLKAVREYPYVNKRTTLFFDAADAFMDALRKKHSEAEVRHCAKMVDVCFRKWQHTAFGVAIIPARYHMTQTVEYAWPAVPTAALI